MVVGDAEASYVALSRYARDGGRSARPDADARWVAKVSLYPAWEIDPEGVPSEAAVGLLRWVQSSPAAAAKFWADVMTKMFPSKSELDAEARMMDDGSDLDELDRELAKQMQAREKKG